MDSEKTNERGSSVFPRPGSMAHDMIYNEQAYKRYIKLFKIANKIVVPLYRWGLVPVLGFGRLFLVITTKGRKSGKERNNPVEYRSIDGVIHVFSGFGKRANWFKNMFAHPDDVYVRVGFQRFRARCEVLDELAGEEVFRWLARNQPTYFRAFGWDPKHDDPETADLSELARMMKVIRLHEVEILS